MRLDHLHALEAESIQIMREVVAEFEHPVMLYSIGKDSSVLLRLAQKAFYPGPNGRLNPGETIRVFPLSNSIELDVWHYIDAERIPVVKRRLRRSR